MNQHSLGNQLIKRYCCLFNNVCNSFEFDEAVMILVLTRVNRGRLVMKAGELQRTSSLFWFMACHMTAKVHIISRWRAESSFARSLREFILFLRMI